MESQILLPHLGVLYQLFSAFFITTLQNILHILVFSNIGLTFRHIPTLKGFQGCLELGRPLNSLS